jgi:hypothetical protein
VHARPLFLRPRFRRVGPAAGRRDERLQLLEQARERFASVGGVGTGIGCFVRDSVKDVRGSESNCEQDSRKM